MNNRELFIINQDNLANADCIDINLAIECTEVAILSYTKNEVSFPDKVSQILNEETQDRINCLPATLINKKICGMKWVSVFPSNASKGLQNLTATVLLSSTETGFPLALIEGTVCSNLRTAAVSAVAAKYLSIESPKAVGFVGAGHQAQYHFSALKAIFPTIEKCYVSSRTSLSESTFINTLKPKHPDVDFIPCNSDYQSAVSNSDIFVSAISGQVPIIKAEWIKPGQLYLHVGGWEDEYGVALKADKIVCDNWDSVKHRTQTLSRMYSEGIITDDNIFCNIDELVSEKSKGRTSPDEFIYFNAVGLSYVDIALASQFYEKCLAKHEGTFVKMQSNTRLN